eukprot:scaffold674200_cov93-Prasinocladus_malaysianus.AAC.1
MLRGAGDRLRHSLLLAGKQSHHKIQGQHSFTGEQPSDIDSPTISTERHPFQAPSTATSRRTSNNSSKNLSLDELDVCVGSPRQPQLSSSLKRMFGVGPSTTGTTQTASYKKLDGDMPVSMPKAESEGGLIEDYDDLMPASRESSGSFKLLRLRENSAFSSGASSPRSSVKQRRSNVAMMGTIRDEDPHQ